MTEKTKERYRDFSNAFDRLVEAHEKDWFSTMDTFVRDALIQRFEITFDVAWKVMKSFLLEQHIIEANSPLVVIQESFKVGIISDAEGWLSMKTSRNETSHIYKEELAIEISKRMGDYLPLFKELRDSLRNDYDA